MKKFLSLICSLSLIASAACFEASAEDAVPVDIDKQAYVALMENYADRNNDGVIDEAELERLTSLTLDLDGVKDISWLSRLKNCFYVTFKGGDITDFSVLKDMPKLKEVTFNSVPLTDISFMKDMELEGCYLQNMDQITLEQRIEVARCSDMTIEKGYSGRFGVYPVGIFGNSKIKYTFDSADIVEELNSVHDNYHIQRDYYGKQEGTVKCHVSVDDVEYFTCNFTVTPMERIAPPLNSTATSPQVYDCFYYGSRNVVVDNGTLYGIRGDQYYKVMDNVKNFSRTYKKNADKEYVYIDLVLLNDGTLILNDKVVEGVKFDYLIDGCAVTADGTLYSVFPDGEEPVIVKAGENFRKLLQSDRYYISESGELIWYFIDYNSRGELVVNTRNTGIMNPKKCSYYYYLDEKGVLWKLNGYSYFSKSRIADDVVDLGYYNSSIGYRTDVYITSDGKAYEASSKKEVELYPDPTEPIELPYLQSGSFYIHEYDSKYGNGGDLLINWFITDDSTLTIDLAGRHFAISDVDRVIDAEYVKYQDKGYAWFIRKDGSIWRYCFEDREAVQMTPLGNMPEVVRYDVNLDGAFNIADVVTLQKWLLSAPDAKLADWQAADLSEDYKLDIFDLVMMKKALVAKLTDDVK